MSLLSLGGLVVGFATQVILAGLFGAGADMDAFLAATTLPQFVIAVLVNSLNYVFIPVFVEHRRKGDLDGAWHVAGALVSLGLFALGGMALIGFVFAGPLQRLLVPGFAPETLGLSVWMARVSWPTVLTTGLATLLGGLYQSHERFGWAATAPVVGAAAMLATTLVLAPTMGIGGVALAALVGSVVQLALLVPLALREPRFRLALGGLPEGARQAMRLMVPLLVGGLFSRGAVLVDRFVASQLATGSLAYLGYANKLVSVIVTVVASGLSVTTFVRMSEHAAGADLSALRTTMAARLRLMWLLTAPAVTMLIALRSDFVSLVFERGRFGAMDTAAVAAVLPWYLLALIAMALGGIVGNGYYALQDTRTPAIIAAVEVAAYAIYMPLLAAHLGYHGVALGFALYWDASIVIISVVLWHKMGRHVDRATMRSAAVTALAAVAGGVAALGGRLLAPGSALLAMLSGSLVGGGAYVLALVALRSTDLREIRVGIMERLAAAPLAREAGRV